METTTMKGKLLGSFSSHGLTLRAYVWPADGGWAWEVVQAGSGREVCHRNGWGSRRRTVEDRALHALEVEGRKAVEWETADAARACPWCGGTAALPPDAPNYVSGWAVYYGPDGARFAVCESCVEDHGPKLRGGRMRPDGGPRAAVRCVHCPEGVWHHPSLTTTDGGGRIVCMEHCG